MPSTASPAPPLPAGRALLILPATPPCSTLPPTGCPSQLAGLTDDLGAGFTGTLFAPSDAAVAALSAELEAAGLELTPALAEDVLVSGSRRAPD